MLKSINAALKFLCAVCPELYKICLASIVNLPSIIQNIDSYDFVQFIFLKFILAYIFLKFKSQSGNKFWKNQIFRPGLGACAVGAGGLPPAG